MSQAPSLCPSTPVGPAQRPSCPSRELLCTPQFACFPPSVTHLWELPRRPESHRIKGGRAPVPAGPAQGPDLTWAGCSLQTRSPGSRAGPVQRRPRFLAGASWRGLCKTRGHISEPLACVRKNPKAHLPALPLGPAPGRLNSLRVNLTFDTFYGCICSNNAGRIKYVRHLISGN